MYRVENCAHHRSSSVSWFVCFLCPTDTVIFLYMMYSLKSNYLVFESCAAFPRARVLVLYFLILGIFWFISINRIFFRNTLDHEATLFLRDFQLQAFMYKAKNAFGAQFQCALAGSVRDETAPIAVGATLSIAVLFTVTGYGIFRYLKVKKVQYDTME